MHEPTIHRDVVPFMLAGMMMIRVGSAALAVLLLGAARLGDAATSSTKAEIVAACSAEITSCLAGTTECQTCLVSFELSCLNHLPARWWALCNRFPYHHT